jgi:DNA-binding response OmpR family regulator
MIIRALNNVGYIIIGAEDGNRALRMIKKNGYDLIILDMMLPGISGLDVLKNLRKDKKHATTKVLIMTAVKLTENLKKDFMELGTSDYLEKPVHIKELRECVKKLIG